MIGDKLVIKEEYFLNSEIIINDILQKNNAEIPQKYIIGIAGESGSGKSVLGYCIHQLLVQKNIKSCLLQQDDYFKLPPKSNHQNRLLDVNNVGIQEVSTEIIQKNIQSFKNNQKTAKPLVDYDKNTILSEELDFTQAQVLIIEGTYTLSLEELNYKVFIDRTYKDTHENRLLRGREAQDEFIEQVLAIESQLISPFKNQANAVINKDYSVSFIDLKE